MKMRGKRVSGWYATCGCWLPGARGSFKEATRALEKQEWQNEVEQENIWV